MRMPSTDSPTAMKNNNSMIVGGETGEQYGEEYTAVAGGEASSSSCDLCSKADHKNDTTDDTENRRTAQEGDIVTLELSLVPENGFVPEPLFDTMGQVSFVLGWGNYLPGLHQLTLQLPQRGGGGGGGGCRVNDVVEHVSLDAGWGRRRADLLFTVKKETLIHQNVDQNSLNDIQPGSWLKIPSPASQSGFTGTTNSTVHVLVDQVMEDAVVLDANPPLSGTSYSCSFRVLSIDSLPSSSLDMVAQQQQPHDDDSDDDAYQEMITTTASISNNRLDTVNNNTSGNFQVATFALGCFWGAELAFARQVGVVGTRVGYTQGITQYPTYQQVCSGTTKHREAVLVLYNARQVSYLQLLQLASERLDQTMGGTTTSTGNSTFITFHEDENDGNDDMNNVDSEYPSQYKPGFYYHSEEQYATARTFLKQRRRRQQHKNGNNNSSSTAIELLPAATFYNAEDYHQQYLYKGGQSTRKGAKETIRCYG